MRKASYIAVLVMLAASAPAQQNPPRLPGFDPAWLDTSVSPCTDFYRYACGLWIKNNPVPEDQSRWGRFNELAERTQLVLREILEEAARPLPGRSPLEQKIGDFYASCMDEEGIEKQGLKPLEPVLSKIRSLKDKKELARIVAELHSAGIPALFGFGASPDYKNSEWIIAGVSQGGLSLPDRDYYLRSDQQSVQIRQKYLVHLAAMFRLAGDSEQEARRKADVVMSIETSLAQASLDRVARRNPENNYHLMAVSELVSLAPSLDWQEYFAAVKAPRFEKLNVQQPGFVKGLESLITSRSVEDLKVYLTWNALRDAAPLLPKPFAEENFAFFGKTLTGAAEQRPRWKRCVALTDAQLGEALGRKYVERAFSPESKQRVLAMVEAIRKAMEKDIQALEWMTPATKKRALEKLQAVQSKIGYPDKWRDYGPVQIVRGDALGNSRRAAEFARTYRLSRIGMKTDPSEWSMTPPTVNAYYSPSQNNINFPAGILQPPFYDMALDDAVNFGAIGAVIGHELTHGFDDQGRKFDSKGNLADWWTPEDAKEFERRAECFVQQYSQYEAVPGMKLNGKLTLGENTADNGGVLLAFNALMEAMEGKPRTRIGGFTPEQRFFLGYAQIWCQNVRPEEARRRALTDPHSPGEFRVNGVVSNSPQFRQAFGCQEGEPMVRPEPCRVW